MISVRDRAKQCYQAEILNLYVDREKTGTQTSAVLIFQLWGRDKPRGVCSPDGPLRLILHRTGSFICLWFCTAASSTRTALFSYLENLYSSQLGSKYFSAFPGEAVAGSGLLLHLIRAFLHHISCQVVCPFAPSQWALWKQSVMSFFLPSSFLSSSLLSLSIHVMLY